MCDVQPEAGVTTQHRDHLLNIMRMARAELDAVVAGYDGNLDAVASDNPDWRIQDVLFHLALWERMAARKIAGTPLPDGEDLAEREPWDIDAFNDAMQARWHDRSAADVLAELAAAHSALVAAVEGADDDACAPGGNAWNAIAEDSAGHYPGHLPVTNLFPDYQFPDE